MLRTFCCIGLHSWVLQSVPPAIVSHIWGAFYRMLLHLGRFAVGPACLGVGSVKLQTKIQIKNALAPPAPGPNRRVPQENDNPDPPPGPPGGGEAKIKVNNR